MNDQLVALEIPFQIVVRPGLAIKRSVHAYLLLGEDTYLIDSGVAGAESMILAAMKACGRDPQSLRAVLLTHAHPDHMGSLQGLREQTGCEVWAHALAKPWIENIDRQAEERPVPGFYDLVAGAVPVDRVIAEGDLGSFPGLGSIQVLHTPGHSRGSISFHVPALGALFTGDAMCVGAGFPVYEDVVTTWQSIQKLARVQPVQFLLGSWDKPRQAHEVSGVFAEARAFLERVHDRVRMEADAVPREQDPLALTRRVIAGLGLPDVAANRLTARAIASHCRYLALDLQSL